MIPTTLLLTKEDLRDIKLKKPSMLLDFYPSILMMLSARGRMGTRLRCSLLVVSNHLLHPDLLVNKNRIWAMQFACRITCSPRRSHVCHWNWKLKTIITTSIPLKFIIYIYIRQHLYHLSMFHLWRAMLWRYLKLANQCEWKKRRATGQTGLSWAISVLSILNNANQISIIRYLLIQVTSPYACPRSSSIDNSVKFSATVVLSLVNRSLMESNHSLETVRSKDFQRREF